MLTFYEGGFYSGVHEELIKRIGNNIAAGKKCILIVPEQQTVMAETEAARILPPHAPLTFEVSNFTRFANTVLRALGGIRTDYASTTKKALIMWRTLTELSGELAMTGGRREISYGTVERALAAVKEAESLGIEAKELAEYSEREEFGKRLSEKLSDLAKIIFRYKAHVREKYADTADDSALVIKKLGEEPLFLSDTEIFLEGFTSFTAPQKSLISVLLTRTDVTVCLNIPKADSSAFEYSELVKTRSRIAALADKHGVEKKVFKFDGRFNVKSPLLSEICPVLWKANYKIDNQSLQNSNDDLRIFEAKTPFDECEFLASDIKRRVMGGASYKDFAIVARDAAKYDGILDTALDKAAIPHFTSYKTDLMSFEAVKLIFAALSASTGFRREDVLAYLASSLSGIDFSERDEFEMYVDKWQIDGERFVDGMVWNMSPSGFDNRRSENADAILERIDATRVKLTTPLLKLGHKISGERSIEEHALAIIDFLEEIEVERALEKRALSLKALGEGAAAEENSRLYAVICDALDTLVEALGECKATAESFASLLKVVFSATEIGRIPAALDEVMIGSADALRLYGKKHIYLIGANYGEFPASVSDNSFFSDKDKVLLSSVGIEADLDTEIKGARELYSFSRAFAAASDSVTLMFSRSDTSFGALIPSLAVGNIVRITDEAVKPVRIDSLGVEEKLFSSGIAHETLGECTREERQAVKEALEATCGGIVFSSGAKIENGALSFEPERVPEVISLTQTRIDTFVSCPLKYFCKFTLSLDEGERAEFGASNIGSYVHAILETFFGEVKRRCISASELTDDEKEEMTRRAAKQYLDGFKNEIGGAATMKAALSRLYRAARPVVDGLCAEFAVSKFTPTFFELPISKENPDSPEPIMIDGDGGEKIFIYGTIDRVDTMKNGDDVYVRVVDYKTGSKTFRPEDLDEGENLQMFLYLKSIIECDKESFKNALGVGESGKVLPAGVIYVKTDISDKRISTPSDEEAKNEISKAQKRMGMVLNDRDIYSAMGADYLPIRLTKNGVHKLTEKYLYTLDEWDDISQKIEKVVGNVGHRIASGDIKAISKTKKGDKSNCEYCAFKAFCRSAKL